MNDHYSDAFKSIVPDAPASDGWAAGARRKRRNRGRAVVGVAAAAAIALVVPIALTMGGNATLIATPDQSETPSPQVADPSPDRAMDAPGAAACWEAPGQPREATREGATDGAVRAWLCGDAGYPETFPGVVGPLEPLVDGVEEIVEIIQQQSVFDVDVECMADAGLDYRIVLDYDDGSQRVVSGGLYGCGVIHDGERAVYGAQELFDRALDLWSQQRGRVNPPNDIVAVSQCRPPSRSVVPDVPPAMRPMLPLAPADAITGFTCIEDPAAEYEESWGSILEPDVVALIAQSVALDYEAGEGEDYLPTWVTITGPWGETLSLQRTAVDTFQWFDGQGPMLSKPSSDVLSQLAAALEFPEATPVSSPQPGDQDPLGPSQPTGCEGVTSVDDYAPELEDGKLTDGPERIWLCDEGSTEGGGSGVPWEPLSTTDLKEEAVAAFNALDPAEANRVCTSDAGPAYTVVHEYPGGVRRAVGVQLFGRGDVYAGQTVKSGGEGYFDTLLGLWQKQRKAEPPVQTRSGTLCPLATSVFDLDPRQEEFQSGWACIGWDATDDGQKRGEEVPLSADLLGQVTQQFVPATPDFKVERMSGDSLILVTTAGDPITLIGVNGGAFHVASGANEWFWIPTGAVADELETIFER